MKEIFVLMQEENDGGFSVSVPSLPGCFSQGETFEEAMCNISEAVNLYLGKNPLPKSKREFVVPLKLKVC
ncbi:MAG: type II toxin-antitoxin system HicB family antitoxin [Candidatus Berkelbacteria bacterium]|nr:type II toxin-antitoxin system HicB family antitoxin [Candidatus Berkelbacteria bacterium]